MSAKKPVAALIDKRPMPEQQWQISVTFTADAEAWKKQLDERIQQIPEKQRGQMQLEANIIGFLLDSGFEAKGRDFFVKA